MRLAEALVERKELKKELQDLSSRITSSYSRNEDEEEYENTTELLQKFVSTSNRLTSLVIQIQNTNNMTTINSNNKQYSGYTISQLIEQRNHISALRNLHSTLLLSGRGGSYRSTKDELKTVYSIPQEEIRKQYDKLSKTYREIDFILQEANFSTNLLDEG